MGGFFGVASKQDCVLELFYGVDYHSHLGTRRGGMAVYGEDGFYRAIHNIENSPFRTKFDHDVSEMKGYLGIGCISDYDPQPLLIQSHLGSFAITTVGKVNNYEELLKGLFEKDHSHFQEMTNGQINVTELVAALICEKNSISEGIKYVQDVVDGSMTMLVMTKEGIYGARDRYGRTPLVIGKKDDSYCLSFESHAYINLGYTDYKELGPCEVVYVTSDGVEEIRPARTGKMKICSFLWVYYGFPTSCYEGRNVEEVRFTSGLKMGQKDEFEVDCACGIPDSGVGMALGYAEGKGVPYHRAISKYTPTWPRSFTPSNQEMRSLVAKMKLIPNRAMLNGKRLLFCDDSIVRGTQLRDNVKVLYDYGAKEVHMRIACPPLIYACPFVGFTASKNALELITRRIIKELEGDENKNLEKYATTGSPEYEKMVSVIAERFGLSSLKFNTLETLIEAIGLPKCQVCTHCFDGSSHF